MFLLTLILNICIPLPMPFDYYDVPISSGLLQNLKARAAQDAVPLDDLLCELVDEILPTLTAHYNQPASL